MEIVYDALFAELEKLESLSPVVCVLHKKERFEIKILVLESIFQN
jgi:hypothetical protein